jgi:hypothetical protein
MTANARTKFAVETAWWDLGKLRMNQKPVHLSKRRPRMGFVGSPRRGEPALLDTVPIFEGYACARTTRAGKILERGVLRNYQIHLDHLSALPGSAPGASLDRFDLSKMVFGG